MNRTALFTSTFLATGLSAVLLLAVSGCDSKDVAAKTPTAPVAAQGLPTPERLVERSAARWKRIAKQEWIEAYDFITPEQKQAVSLAQFLQGKSSHEYTNPRVGDVLKIDKDQAFVRVSTLWTPHHPQLAKVKLEPGQTLTTDIDIIESWRFVSGEWYYVRAQKEEEFFEHHPELLKKATDADATPNKSEPKSESESK